MRFAAWLVCALLAVPRLAAAYQDLRIFEIYTGPGPQYVMLRSFSSGQDQLTDHSLLVYNASGALVQTNKFGSPDFVSDLPTQGSVLIGTSNVGGTFFV